MYNTKVVVLISGNGSNLQALIDGQQSGTLPIKIAAVISNRPNAYGLTRAANANIETQVINHQQFADRESFDLQLIETIDRYRPQLVVLAGFMRILTPEFVAHYEGKLLNIHPSLLPSYRGLNTHQRALAAGEKYHGATVHFVTLELDGGPLIVQARVKIFENDAAANLAKRVQEVEHIIYPEAVKWFAENRLIMRKDKVYLDGKVLETPVIYSGDTGWPASLSLQSPEQPH
ncbi:MAG: phosphoribosylglycinamide formyltransferase [Gammaproteobacteria bacterium]|nr:phosphoribosylglycinamide formyltransferase [Gammaproteobacteria bacterium]